MNIFDPITGEWKNAKIATPVFLQNYNKQNLPPQPIKSTRPHESSVQIGWTLTTYNTGYADNLLMSVSPNRIKCIYHNPNTLAILYLSFKQARPYAECIALQPNEKWVDDIGAIGDTLYVGSQSQNAIFVSIETTRG